MFFLGSGTRTLWTEDDHGCGFGVTAWRSLDWELWSWVGAAGSPTLLTLGWWNGLGLSYRRLLLGVRPVL